MSVSSSEGVSECVSERVSEDEEKKKDEMPNFMRVKENFLKRLAEERSHTQGHSRDHNQEQSRAARLDEKNQRHISSSKKSSNEHEQLKGSVPTTAYTQAQMQKQKRSDYRSLAELVDLDNKLEAERVHRKSLQRNNFNDDDLNSNDSVKPLSPHSAQSLFSNEPKISTISPHSPVKVRRRVTSRESSLDIDDLCNFEKEEDEEVAMENVSGRAMSGKEEISMEYIMYDDSDNDSDNDAQDNDDPDMPSTRSGSYDSQDECRQCPHTSSRRPSHTSSFDSGSSVSSESSSASNETRDLSVDEEEGEVDVRAMFTSLKSHRIDIKKHNLSTQSVEIVDTTLAHSRNLLCRLMRMQAQSGKGPLCSNFGRSLSSMQEELEVRSTDTYYCSGSTEAAVAIALKRGQLKNLLKSQVEMLVRLKAMLPLEDGDSFLGVRSTAAVGGMSGSVRSNRDFDHTSSSGGRGGRGEQRVPEDSSIQLNPFDCDAMANLIQMLDSTLKTIEVDEVDVPITKVHVRSSYRYAGCSDDADDLNSPTSLGENNAKTSSDIQEFGAASVLQENVSETHIALGAQLQVCTGSLALLSLTGRILRAEQRIVALRRLYHQKSSRLSDCEDKLLDSAERSRKHQVEVDQLKLRIGSLQESLSYHRVAADRIQTLEDSLALAELEKLSALEALEHSESQLKYNEYANMSRSNRDVERGDRSHLGIDDHESSRRGDEHVGTDRREFVRVRRVTRAQNNEDEVYSDDDSTEEYGNMSDSTPPRNLNRNRYISSQHSVQSRNYRTNAEDKTVGYGTISNRDHKVEDGLTHHSNRAYNGVGAAERKVNCHKPQKLIEILETISINDVENFYSKFTDDELSKCSSALATVSSKIEEAKRLSIQRKEKELADSKISSAENSLCCICRDATKTILLLPCRHLCLCEDCSLTLRKHRGTCPVCREIVRDTLRVFA